jgi:hypothetical protein
MKDHQNGTIFNEHTLYKCLYGDRSCHGGRGKWAPGRWRFVKVEVVACRHGIHYCRGAQVLGWLSPDLWLFEDGGTRHDDRSDKCVTNRGRVTEHVDTWNEETARLFAVDCARIAVNRHAQGDQRELLHACLDVTTAAAWDAAGAAAWAAAWAAARAAARDAAWAAARDAARAAASAAASDAAWAAARAAASAAASDAARDTAWDTAWAAAREEQYALLCRYLKGEQGPFVGEGDA